MEKKDRTKSSPTTASKTAYGEIKEHKTTSPAESIEKPGEKSASYDESIIQRLEEKSVPKITDKVYNKMLPRVIEALGIFVALFTFISIEIQIFSRISDLWSAGIFSILVFCLSGMLLSFLHFIITDYNQKRFYLDKIFLITIILIFFSLASLFLLKEFPINPVEGTIKFEQMVNERIDGKINELINTNNKDFYTKTEIDNFFEGIKKR